MRRTALAILLAITAGCSQRAAQPPGEITVADLVAIFDVRVWRVPLPADRSKQWSIDVVDAASVRPGRGTLSQTKLGTAGGTIAFRPEGEHDYRFTIVQNGIRNAGMLTPCAEPARSKSFCDEGYRLEFHEDPVCTEGCASFILADIHSMLNDGEGKRLVITLIPRLVIG